MRGHAWARARPAGRRTGLANRAGINGVFFGDRPRAATARPEIISGIAAIGLGNHALAARGIFGGNAFHVCLLVFADVVSGRAPCCRRSDTSTGWLAGLENRRFGRLRSRNHRAPAALVCGAGSTRSSLSSGFASASPGSSSYPAESLGGGLVRGGRWRACGRACRPCAGSAIRRKHERRNCDREAHEAGCGPQREGLHLPRSEEVVLVRRRETNGSGGDERSHDRREAARATATSRILLAATVPHAEVEGDLDERLLRGLDVGEMATTASPLHSTCFDPTRSR